MLTSSLQENILPFNHIHPNYASKGFCMAKIYDEAEIQWKPDLTDVVKWVSFNRDLEVVIPLPSGSFCGQCGLSLWVKKGKQVSLEWLIMNLKSLFL